MKFGTYWWGTQILAETDDDVTILESLVNRLPQKTDFGYERGVLDATKDTSKLQRDDGLGGFDELTLRNAKMVITFDR